MSDKDSVDWQPRSRKPKPSAADSTQANSTKADAAKARAPQADPGGLTVSALLELPAEVRQLVRWMTRKGKVSLPEIFEHYKSDEATARAHLDILKAQGVLQEIREQGVLSYRLLMGGKSNRPSVSEKTWRSLDQRRLQTIKRRLYEIFEETVPNERGTTWFHTINKVLIIVSVLVAMAGTVATLHTPYQAWFLAIRQVTAIIFTAEYVLRLWVCTFPQQYRHPVWGRLRFALTPLIVLDLLAIATLNIAAWGSYVEGQELEILVIARMARYTGALKTLFAVFNLRRRELTATFILLLTLLVFSSTVLYLVEYRAQPEVFSSIPAAMWWGVITLTTIGYGDMIPITALGRFLGGCVALLGFGLFALPAGIIASGFAEELQKRNTNYLANEIGKRLSQGKIDTCPHCGKPLK